MNFDFENIETIINRCKAKAPKAKYECLSCKDTGFIIINQIEGQPTFRECQCRKKDRLRNQWENNGFNMRCNDLTWSKFNENKNIVSKRMKEIAGKFIKDFECIQFNKNNSIAFLGEPGAGKTHICIAISLELLKKGVNTVYFPYRDCMDEMIDLRISNKNKYDIKVSKYQKCNILFLDDVFKGGYTDAEIKLLFKIINYRYINRLPIIVSSEYLSDDLLKIDKGIASRIVEMAKNRTLDITGIEFNQRLYCE
ncbi:MAG: ATP-binding protein [Clostridium butyricum]